MCDTSNIIRSTAYARGTVWWVTLQIDPMCDTLQRFKRPCLIISNDEFNMKFGKVTIIPMSSKQKYDNWDNIVVTSWGSGNSYILCDQIRQIDTQYLTEYAFTLNPKCMEQVEQFLLKFYFTHNDNVDIVPVVEHKILNEGTTTKENKVAKNNSNKELITNTTDSLNEIRQSNQEIIEKTIQSLKDKVDKMVNRVTVDSNSINTITNEEKVKDNVSTYFKKAKKAETSKSNKSKKTPAKKFNVTATNTSRRGLSMPYRFFVDIDNNIDFWNDLVTYGKAEVCKKYKLLDNTQFNRRKSRVKLLLEKHGYNPTMDKIIERK